MEEKAMRPFTIAMLYIGALMGAGFASGKEIYAYFGAYGRGGLWGLLFVTVLFVVLGTVLLRFARWREPSSHLDLLCFGSPRLRSVLDWSMFFVFANVFMAMLAAGGAVWEQQLGLPAFAGGLVTGLLVYGVVVRGIRGIVGALQYMVPVVLVLALGTAIILWVSPPLPMEPQEAVSPPGFFGFWPLAALVYLSYNFLGCIPILTAAAPKALSDQKAFVGGGLGGLCLGVSAFLLYRALLADPVAAHNYPMPMLYFAGEISLAVQMLYTVAMLLAILCAAINSLFVVAQRLPADPGRRAGALALVCAACYVLSLMGFTNVVRYVYPIQGYIGLLVISLLVTGFIREARKRRTQGAEQPSPPTSAQ